MVSSYENIVRPSIHTDGVSRESSSWPALQYPKIWWDLQPLYTSNQESRAALAKTIKRVDGRELDRDSSTSFGIYFQIDAQPTRNHKS